MAEFPIRRIAVANRGEPAMRLIHAVRDFNLERGTAIETVAMYTDTDRQSMFVREADVAFELGPALIEAEDGSRKVGYLDYDRLVAGIKETGADAVWAGWGFVSEHADFVARCESMGVTFIGPDSETMRRLGDKITSKRIAEDAGVSVVPWSKGPVDTVEEAMALTTDIEDISLILSDIRLEGAGTGLDLVEQLGGRLPCILMTSLPYSDPLHQRALAMAPVLQKPFAAEQLSALIRTEGH